MVHLRVCQKKEIDIIVYEKYPIIVTKDYQGNNTKDKIGIIDRIHYTSNSVRAHIKFDNDQNMDKYTWWVPLSYIKLNYPGSVSFLSL